MSVCSDWSRQTGIWSPPLATSPWSSGSELVARRTKSLRNRSSTFGLNTLTTPPRRPLRTAFVCLFLYGSPRRWINICISFRKQFIILFVGLHAQLCHCEQWSWGKVLDHRESLLVMHQIQAMQAGKICFDLYFQPLITHSEKIDCWKEKRSEMLGLIFLFFLLPLYQFLSSLTHGNWQPRISRRWPLRKGLYSLFHLIFMWWRNKLSKKCSTELCMEQTMCALFKSSLKKKKNIAKYPLESSFLGKSPLIWFPLSWCCTTVLFFL